MEDTSLVLNSDFYYLVMGTHGDEGGHTLKFVISRLAYWVIVKFAYVKTI